MIYILDNNLFYSDHQIAFVDVPPEKEEAFLALLERDKATSPESYTNKAWTIIAARVEADWREPSAISSAESFMEELAERIADRAE